MTGTTNSHGVWQVPPFEVLANAPRGLESIVKVASVDGASQSKRGVFEDTDEQLASARPNTMATNPAVLITSVLLLPEPNTIHGQRDFAQAYERLAVVEPRAARGNREPDLRRGTTASSNAAFRTLAGVAGGRGPANQSFPLPRLLNFQFSGAYGTFSKKVGSLP
jgi:hypothetical protein